MKKILFSLVALVASMSMNAQVMKVMKNGEEVAKYKGAEYSVVFEEAQASTTTGTAKATIGSSEVDVNWVQLWAGGPKFADRNVEGTMTFTDATKTGADYVWGANWCTPSKDDLNELFNAATNTGSTKVKCEYTQEGGVYGFKFTGKEEGYNDNSVFIPANDGDSEAGVAEYWSSTADDSQAWLMVLLNFDGYWDSNWTSYGPGLECLVRPVLKN